MRRLSSILLIAGLVLAACGTATDSAPMSRSAGTPTSTQSEMPVSPTDGRGSPSQGEGRAERVVPRPGMADLRPIGWEKARQSASGRSLRITYWSGVEPCNVLDHVDVRYGDKRIVVTLYEGHDPDEGDVACIELALLKEVVVPLEEAVAGRKIVDGAR